MIMSDAKRGRLVPLPLLFAAIMPLLPGLGTLSCPLRTASAQLVPHWTGTGKAGEDATHWNPERFFEALRGTETEAQKQKLAAIEISPDEEKRFGDRAADLFLAELRQQGIRTVSDGPEVRYLRRLVQELQPHLRHAERYPNFTLWLAETSVADARCFPSGTVVIFRGMLDAAQSEAGLVCVLAHELSHIDHGHQLRQLKSLKLAQQTFQPRRMPELQRMMNNTMFLAQTFARPFRPEDERVADEDAVTWAYRLGYDPLEFAELFRRWMRRDNRQGQDTWTEELPEFLRSHPPHRDRYQAVVARVRKLNRSEPRKNLYVGRKNLQQLVPRSECEYDE